MKSGKRTRNPTYPAPILANQSCMTNIQKIEGYHSCMPTSKEIMAEYPTVLMAR